MFFHKFTLELQQELIYQTVCIFPSHLNLIIFILNEYRMIFPLSFSFFVVILFADGNTVATIGKDNQIKLIDTRMIKIRNVLEYLFLFSFLFFFFFNLKNIHL